ncbi:MAG TPA: antibiotic biosynthesis monooxygenase family protein [Candidatus Binatia bacterium]|jgi:quinol monooxygenase YgiN|nr:antibiotic biosynthesis monooxygenase family protein [Candidatus Binatia bacterium]
MVQIASDNDVATLINVFTVSPDDQQKLVDLLVEATQKTMRHIPGFVSASIHKSADGTRVTNYAQWRRAEDFEAMLKDPRAAEHMKPIKAIATNDAHLYDVVEGFTAG